jgi:3-deoxy-D-manno-octulosonic-acid transferase
MKVYKMIQSLIFFIYFFIYNIIYLLFFPIILLIYFLLKDLNYDFKSRFSFFIKEKYSDSQNNILIHCSSIGESILASSFFGGAPNIFYSTFNKAGYDYLRGRNFKVFSLPFDFFIFCFIFLKKLKIKKLILIEQEIWPSLIFTSKLLKINLIIFNGIIYDRSFPWQKRLRFFYKFIFNLFDKIYTQSFEMTDRFISLGTKKEILITSGNIKLYFKDLNFPIEEKYKLFSNFSKPIVIFSSFHDDEFCFINQFVSRFYNNFIVVIAPRFLNNLNILKKLIEIKKLNFISDFISFEEKPSLKNLIEIVKFIEKNEQILVLDIYGILRDFYKLSKYVVVGGSFNGKGGQNFVEPIAFLNLTFIGPSYNNFLSVYDFFSNKSLFSVNDFYELILKFEIILDEEKKSRINKNFANIYLRNQSNLIQSQNFIINSSTKFEEIKNNLVNKM